jgi:hypothetical protein
MVEAVHRRDGGQLLLVLALLVAVAGLGGAMAAQVAHTASLRGGAQAAADGAALAAADVLRAGLRGGDAATWGCDEVPLAELSAAAERVADANRAEVLHVERSGCEVGVVVRSARGGRIRDALGDGGGDEVGGSGRRVRAEARASVRPGQRPGGGLPSQLRVPAAPLARGTLLTAMVAEAERIDRLRLPYVWGGGHQSSPAPPDGPFDCSGAVSRLLQSIGYPIPTLVSRDFLAVGAPGPGRVTIWAYDGHVFLVIDGRGWGTGSPPNAGAGWLPYAAPYHSRFVARHLPELEDDTVVDLRTLDLGDVRIGADRGSPPVVGLVGGG